MLKITAAELETLAAHYTAEIADGFGVEVTVVRMALEVGDNTITQDEYLEVYGMVHRSLERLEGVESIDRTAYDTLTELARKVDAYEESMYKTWNA